MFLLVLATLIAIGKSDVPLKGFYQDTGAEAGSSVTCFSYCYAFLENEVYLLQLTEVSSWNAVCASVITVSQMDYNTGIASSFGCFTSNQSKKGTSPGCANCQKPTSPSITFNVTNSPTGFIFNGATSFFKKVDSCNLCSLTATGDLAVFAPASATTESPTTAPAKSGASAIVPSLFVLFLVLGFTVALG